MAFNIERTDYGCRMHFSGPIDGYEMKHWLFDAISFIHENLQGTSFQVLVDLRDTILPPSSGDILVLCQWVFRLAGMNRNAILLPEKEDTDNQLVHAALMSGIESGARRLRGKDAMERALRWIYEGKV